MINTIIFDFGDVFINLEKEASIEEFKKLGLDGPNQDLLAHNDLFEKGKITELQFSRQLTTTTLDSQAPHLTHQHYT
jgi:putative hydrolase of the HAD superfamily